MAYIPPAVHQRANRPVFVRPSGAGAAAGNIRIVDMPRNGRLFIDGVEWMGGGHWDDDEPNVWVVPNAPPGRVLRVEDQYGNARGREWTTAIRWATLDSGELDWDSLTPIEDADVGTLRILNGPVGGGTVWIDGQPVAPLPETPAWNGHSVNWPAGEVAVRIQTPAGEVRTAVVTVPSNLDFNAMTVMAPAPAIGVGEGAGAGTSAGTITVRGFSGWVYGLGAVGASVNPRLPFPASGVVGPDLYPPGDYDMIVRAADGASARRRVTIRAGENTDVDARTMFPERSPAAPATGPLTVTGVPGWIVAIALPGSTNPLTPPATIPPTGGITVPAPVGSYDLAVSDGVRPIQVRRITVTAAGLTVDTRSFFDAAPGGGESTPSRPNLTVTGTAGWMLTLTPSGSSAFVNRLPILTGGTVAFPVTPGSYSLKVEDGSGHTASRDITVPAAGLAVDVGPWFADQVRSTQGPTAAAPTKGTIILRGAPGQSVVTIPAAGLLHTVDASGRPVALDVLPGTYGLTVTPVGDVQRVQSVTVAAGQTVEVVYGTMPTPFAQTADTGLQPVDAMCGPVLNRASLAWAPATACPGNEFAAPDGTRWRAIAAAGGVNLMQLKADGTLADTGMGLGTKVLIVGVVAAAGYAGWMWYSNRKGGKQENPGKCSCGG